MSLRMTRRRPGTRSGYDQTNPFPATRKSNPSLSISSTPSQREGQAPDLVGVSHHGPAWRQLNERRPLGYRMRPGDALQLDGEGAHGPQALVEQPIRFLSVVAYGW